MKIERNEISTGLLVFGTVGILVAVILALAAPGLFKKLDSYDVFFDNAGGIKPGAPVLVAGRKIGQVSNIVSPIPRARRPAAARGGWAKRCWTPARSCARPRAPARRA